MQKIQNTEISKNTTTKTGDGDGGGSGTIPNVLDQSYIKRNIA